MDDIFSTKNLYLAKLTRIKQLESGKLSWANDGYNRYSIVYLDSQTSVRARDLFSSTISIIAKRASYEELSNSLGAICVIDLEPISLFMKKPSNEVSGNELISILNRFDELRKSMFGIKDVVLRLIAELNSQIYALDNLDEGEKKSIIDNLYKIAYSYVQDLVDYNSGKLMSGSVESIREMYLKEALKVQSEIEIYIPKEQTKIEDELDNLGLLLNKN